MKKFIIKKNVEKIDSNVPLDTENENQNENMIQNENEIQNENVFPSEPEYEDFDDTLSEMQAAQQSDEDFLDEEPSSFDEMSENFFAEKTDRDFIDEDPVDDYDEDEEEISKSQKKDNDFGDFIKETVTNLRDWIKKNSKTSMIIAISAAVVVLIIVVLSIVSSHRAAGILGSVSNNDMNVNPDPTTSVIPVPTDPLQENAYPEVNALIQRYITAKQNNDVETLCSIRNLSSIELIRTDVLSNYVEEYRDVTCYTKAGPFPDSYIVYVSYGEKFRDWDVIAPSLLALLVCTKDNGDLYIYSGDIDQNVADYIKIISSQDDVKDLIQRINTEYIEVIDANPNFKIYLEALHNEIKDTVGEQLAAEVTVSDNEIVDDGQMEVDSTGEDGSSESTDTENQEETKPSTFEVRTTTTVNVRASDSELADKLGKVEAGTVLVCNEQKLNGWSEVIYNGQVGYIKSDYVTVVGGNTTTELPEVIGTVTTNDTVNIRGTASVDGERVGVAYAGETFDLVEQGSEWTKIIYENQVAYIKTEYIAK